MITAEQKVQVGQALLAEFNALGSWKAVARKVNANDVTIRYNMMETAKWGLVSDRKWMAVAEALGLKLTNTGWQIVDTNNTRQMREYLTDAQQQAMFMAVSHPAGQGKTVAINLHRANDPDKATYVLECEEAWSHKTFMQKLAGTLGIDVTGLSVSALTDEIVSFFKRRATATNPLLILDEANKLKPSSLRLIIPLYNKLKGEMGLVIVGADDLERHIKHGVKRQVRGYDELDSRLGRRFMHLYGATKEDVEAIGRANGITTTTALEQLWAAMCPERVLVDGIYTWLVTEDLRRLERLVVGNRIKQAQAQPHLN